MSAEEHSPDDTTKKPGQEAGDNTKDNLAPAGKKSVGNWVLFAFEIVTFGAVATALWILGEHLDKNGYPHFGAWVNFLAFGLLMTVVPVAVLKFWPTSRHVWLYFAGSVGLLALMWGVILYNKPSRPEARPEAKLAFSLRIGTNVVYLTNDFLITAFGKANTVAGYVTVPRTLEQTNIGLLIGIHNAPDTIAAHDILVWAIFPPEWDCAPGPDWMGWESDPRIGRGWACPFPKNISLLPGNGIYLQEIRVTKVPSQPGLVALGVRSGDSGAFGVNFWMTFPPITSNSSPWMRAAKPFVVMSHTNASGFQFIAVTQEEYERLTR